MTLAEYYIKSNKPSIEDNKPKVNNRELNIVVRMPEVSSLIARLDLMLIKLLSNNQQNNNQPVVDILGVPHIQTRSYFNPGQGIKQSAAVQ